MKVLFVCQIFLVLSIIGTKLTLKKPEPCPTCGEEAQTFYEQGKSDYCTQRTVRYISCNLDLLDAEAITFYLADIIFDQVNLSKENSCSQNDSNNYEEFYKIYQMVVKKLQCNSLYLARLDKEKKTIKMFQMLNEILKKLSIYKSFEENKCVFCSKMTFNTIKSDYENQICFLCYSKDTKEKMKSKICNKSSRKETYLKLAKMIEYKIRRFETKMRKYFSIRTWKRVKFSGKERKMRKHIDWTNILAPRKVIQENLEKEEDYFFITFDYLLNMLLLGMILLFVKNHSLDHIVWFIVHKLILDNLFVELKSIYFATKLTSIHKNIEFRRAEFEMQNAEKILMTSLHALLICWYRGFESFDFLSPHIFLCGIVALPLNQIMTSCVMHLKKKQVLQEEYKNFL